MYQWISTLGILVKGDRRKHKASDGSGGMVVLESSGHTHTTPEKIFKIGYFDQMFSSETPFAYFQNPLVILETSSVTGLDPPLLERKRQETSYLYLFNRVRKNVG